MKKFLVTTFATLFATATFAQTVSIGVSGTALYYDASGSETVKSSGTVNDKSDNGLAPVGSIFIETELDTGAVVGLEYVPYSAEVGSANNARTDTDTDDSADTAGDNKVDVNFKDHATLYVETPLTQFDGGYLKLGVSTVTLETDDTLATGSKYGNGSIMGLTVGVGKKADLPNGNGFYKIEAAVSRYEGHTFEGSEDADSVKNTVKLDDWNTAGIKFSVGKSF